MRICFFVDQAFFQATGPFRSFPKNVRDFEAWLNEFSDSGSARADWTLQTYLRLKEAGADIELATGNHPPKDGIVIAHADSFHWLGPKPFRVCIGGDRTFSVEADLYVVQNLDDPRKPAYFIPFWPQFGLIPRKEGRRIENVVYYGWKEQLAPELRRPEFTEAVARLGLTVRYMYEDAKRQSWCDYSEADIVLAVRGFGGDPYNRKPATKLYNAWTAGAPAILGCESAYTALRTSPLDYLEARSPKEVLERMADLRNPQLYEQMVENGRKRAAEFTVAAITKRWLAFLERLETEHG